MQVKTKRCDSVVALRLTGPIVIGETTTLRDAVLSQSDAKAIVLDLAGVRIIDAAGLGAMLELRAATESKGIRFRLMNLTRTVSELLEITCLNSVFEITSGLRNKAVTTHLQQLNYSQLNFAG